MSDERYSRGADGKGYLRKGGFVVQDDAGNNVAYIGLMMDGTSRGIQILDETGNSLVRLGDLPDGSQGLQITSQQYGFDLVKMTDVGWSAPHIAGVTTDPAASKTVTSSAFAEVWRVTFGSVLGPGVEVMFPWATGVTTTGELMLQTSTPAVTTPLILPANSSGFAFCRWLHGSTIGAGPFTIQAMARRATGSNNVLVYATSGWVQDPSLCSIAGTWV